MKISTNPVAFIVLHSQFSFSEGVCVCVVAELLFIPPISNTKPARQKSASPENNNGTNSNWNPSSIGNRHGASEVVVRRWRGGRDSPNFFPLFQAAAGGGGVKWHISSTNMTVCKKLRHKNTKQKKQLQTNKRTNRGEIVCKLDCAEYKLRKTSFAVCLVVLDYGFLVIFFFFQCAY